MYNIRMYSACSHGKSGGDFCFDETSSGNGVSMVRMRMDEEFAVN